MKLALPVFLLALAVAAILVGWPWTRQASHGALELDRGPGSLEAPASAGVLEVAESEGARSALPLAESRPPRAERDSDVDALLLTRQKLVLDGVIVRRTGGQDVPIEDAEIALLDESRNLDDSDDRPPALDARIVARVRSSHDGSFGIHGIRFARCRLRARLESGEQVEYQLGAFTSPSRANVRLVVGSSTLEGVVRTTDGAPQPGVVLRLVGTAPPSESAVQTWVETDRDGRYRVVGLAPGPYELSVGAARSHAFVRKAAGYEQLEGWPSRTIAFDLAESETQKLDVGTPGGARAWRGCVRTPEGDRYAAGKILVLEREQPNDRGGRARTNIRLTTQSKENFELHVEPGEWRVSVAFAPKDIWTEGLPLLVDARDLERDLVIPGTRVTGRAIDSATGQVLLPGLDSVHVRIRRFRAESDKDSDHDALVRRDGTYSLLVRGEGDWVVTSAPFPLQCANKRLDLHIGPRQTEYTLDLSLLRP